MCSVAWRKILTLFSQFTYRGTFPSREASAQLSWPVTPDQWASRKRALAKWLGFESTYWRASSCVVAVSRAILWLSEGSASLYNENCQLWIALACRTPTGIVTLAINGQDSKLRPGFSSNLPTQSFHRKSPTEHAWYLSAHAFSCAVNTRHRRQFTYASHLSQ